MFIEIIGVIAILMALRAVITVSALIALYIQTPFGLVLAATFFISSTIGANAIAYSLKDLEDEITYDKNMEEHKEN